MRDLRGPTKRDLIVTDTMYRHWCLNGHKTDSPYYTLSPRATCPKCAGPMCTGPTRLVTKERRREANDG